MTRECFDSLMIIIKKILPTVLLVCAATASAGAPSERCRLVDPFLGVDGGGNTTPAAGVPFGFVRVCADMENPPTSGYATEGRITGLSQTHVSGTGGASKYGNFLVTPGVDATVHAGLTHRKGAEEARPGYYSVELADAGIRAEVTATRLVALHRYTFPEGRKPHVAIEASAVIKTCVEQMIQKHQRPLECRVRLVGLNGVEGTGSFAGGWNPQPYTLHFAARFDREAEEAFLWRDGRRLGSRMEAAGAGKTGACHVFSERAPRTLLVKVAVSFVSVEKARANLEAEMPGWSFEEVHDAAERQWEEVLSKVTVTGGAEDQRRQFYSALYRAHMMPHDLTGENVWWRSAEPHYEDFYCIWDTFRTLHPLLTLIQPERQRDMLRSLIDTYVHTGWMPDARIAGSNGMTQGGSNADVLIADAAVKGLGGVDYEKAFEAMLKNGEEDSPRPLHEGRQLRDYLRLGYVPMPREKVKDRPSLAEPDAPDEYRRNGYNILENSRSASRTMEYAYNDFCIAQVAGVLGRTDLRECYLARSRNWTNLWDGRVKSVRPRHSDGEWLEPFSPVHDYPDKEYDFWDAPFYEGCGWQYSTYVPHDIGELMRRLGGAEGFVAWLDAFFDRGIFNAGNEPGFLAPYLYIHAGRHPRTAERVRKIVTETYRSGRSGLPGNDDAGAMSSWYIWGSIGLYPNAGQAFYYIGSPIYRESRIRLAGGREFVVKARGNPATEMYVKSASLNGRPLERAWLTHREVAEGGTLELTLSSTPETWGAAEAPPTMESSSAEGTANGNSILNQRTQSK